MKKISLILALTMVLVSCKKEQPKNYLTLSGKFSNSTDSIFTINGPNLNKSINLNADGTFSDTLKVPKAGLYTFQLNPAKRAPIFLNNGYNLTVNVDTKDFLNSVSFQGEGASSNNYILSQIEFSKKLGNPMLLFGLEKEDFDKKVTYVKEAMDSITNLYTNIDTTLVNNTKKQNEQFVNFLKSNYAAQHEQAKQRANAMKLIAKGLPSPAFTNYENFKGGKTSLKDLKGKYVYIDLWATWCKPCIGEIPYLKDLEKEYHNKNIEFVSISIDNERTAGTWEKAHEKWKKMVANKNLTGVQLYAAKDTDFVQAYQVTGIPRFILIDPKGNIVDANAPRPSDSRLKQLFTELGI